jgi:acyl-CoA dehydrogenase
MMKAGEAPGPALSAGKILLTRGHRSASHLVQSLMAERLLADTGEWGTFAWNEYVLGVPGTRIAGGTDEIQRNIIAERVLGLPREPRGGA